MTDVAAQTPAPAPPAAASPPGDKKDVKPGNAGQRGGKKGGPVRPSSTSDRDREGKSTSRPASRGSQKKGHNSANAGSGNGSAAEGEKKGDNKPRRENSQRSAGGGRRSGPGQGRPTSANKEAAVPAPPAAISTSAQPDAALNSLQKMINDMKGLQSPVGTAPLGPAPATQPTQPFHSTLMPDAPVFQPGVLYAPPPMVQEQPDKSDVPPRHRKAASMSAAPSFSSYTFPQNNSGTGFSTQLGPMVEDIEDNAAFEEGEIPDSQQPIYTSGAQQPQQQAFTAPRFAALAAQRQQQAAQAPEPALGPSGRPQLAPSFVFGARKRGASAAGGVQSLGPAIGEEDGEYSLRSPQSDFGGPEMPVPMTMPMPMPTGMGHGRTQSEMPGMTGLMAEQIMLQNQIEALQQQQQQLLQQQLAAGGVVPGFPGMNHSQLPAAAARSAAHRRIQSQQVPMGGMGMMGGFVPGEFPQNSMPPAAMAAMSVMPGMPFGVPGMNPQTPPMPVPQPAVSQSAGRGAHGRRHSVNVLAKGHQPQPSMGYNFYNEGYDEAFSPPMGHSRQPSRQDSTWRINGGAGAVQHETPFSADLAQAQAQLQSLQQFRAASGGHHQKMASFSFPNMLPNFMAANALGMPGFNLFQQQQQQFQMQLQQQANQPQRKSLFAPYLPQASLPPLLGAGKLVVGILRVNKRNRSDAYVSTEVLDADIYICGSKDRNRALEGDIVAVELLDVDEVWGTKKEKEEKKRKKEENAAYDIVKLNAGKKNDKKKDDVEVEGQGLMLFEDEEVTDEVKPQFAGHVVAVVERMPGQLFSGTLGLLRPSSAATKEKQEAERREREGDKEPAEEKRSGTDRPKIVWFKPTDKRVPLIAIPTEQAPPDFVENSEAYANRLFVACIKRHPISSLHPFGTLVEELGPIGDLEVETSALLKDCNFPTEDFSDNVLKCLPPLPWTIPDREYETRRDLRGDRIFTIDPSTAKDLDDAMSVRKNEDGTYDVSVHIADVSYFVKPSTALDRDAKKRATSVYLIQRAVPMLPPALSEELCSLVPGVDRLAFTAIFNMSPQGKVIGSWFGRTIIRSAAKLAYSNAQNVIDGHPLGDVEVSPEHTASEIEEDIKILHDLATKLREARWEAGGLRIHSQKLHFELDDNNMPLDCEAYDRTEANSLIEEFMLLTNLSVAKMIAAALPEQAMLRRHEEPVPRRLERFAEQAARLGVAMDVSSAGALQKSFNAIEDPLLRRQLEILATKAMHRAKYFCSGMLDIAKYQHYGLNAPLYTHFTSPIRRYADVLVHRQLDCVLQNPQDVETRFNMDRDAVAKVAQQCNIKRDSAKLAQEQSAHLYLCLLLSDLSQRYGPVIRQARVIGILDAAFDVFVPDFGIEKRVHVDQMPIENHVYDEHAHSLQIYWTDKDVISWLAENSSDDPHLQKMRRTAEMHARNQANMELSSRQATDESALFEEPEDDEPADSGAIEVIESHQHDLSRKKEIPLFEGLRDTGGHKIQEIKEAMLVPVIVTADLTKSPPVIKVYSVNPYASKK